MNPLVSVIIPAYNAYDFIVETINSVVSQTYSPIEIIVVDDGSQDNTSELVQSTFGDGVKLLTQVNSGPSAARNRGILESTGEYIAFLDADDIWLPEKIENQIALMEKQADIVLICGDMLDFDESGNERLSHFEKNGLDERYFGNGLYVTDAFRKIYNKNFISTPTVVLRSSVLKNTDLFPVEFRFSEDYLFWLDVARFGKVAYQKEVYTRRRKHAANLTNETIENVRIRPMVLDRIAERHGEYLKEQGINIRDRYASAWFQIGYYRLYTLGYTDNTKEFAKSFVYRPSLRSFLYAFAMAIGMGRVALRLKNYRDRKREA
jgi:glycosyltransferase involved in cell wall biosynthesis